MENTVRFLCAGIFLILWQLEARAMDDRLGRLWTGCEYQDCSWTFQWERRANGKFAGRWHHATFGRFKGMVEIQQHGDSILVLRPPLAGGTACRYSGTLRQADHTANLPARVYGTYTCGTYTGPWRATIKE